MRTKPVATCGRPVHLRRMFSAMVNVRKGKADVCRTLYEDDDGALWCVWNGSLYKTRKASTLRYEIDSGTRVRIDV